MRTERGSVIEAILAAPWGIYGAEVCQACGEIGTFRGWASAVGSHFGRDHQFIASDHRHLKESRSTLDGESRRFCEVCRQTVARETAKRISHFWLCDRCHSSLTLGGETDLADKIQGHVRRRYLERLSDDVLRRWSQTLANPT